MKEKPILFSDVMVKAILEGRKHQTRRVMKPQPMKTGKNEKGEKWFSFDPEGRNVVIPWQPEMRLWVKETWGVTNDLDPEHSPVVHGMVHWTMGIYEARREWPGRKRSARFMPRWARRIDLVVTNVRAERVQEISREDAAAEGLKRFRDHVGGFYFAIDDADLSAEADPRMTYQRLWDRLNKARGFGWEVNPWVWVIDFEVTHVLGMPERNEVTHENAE